MTLLQYRNGEGSSGEGISVMTPKELEELKDFFVNESINLQNDDWDKSIKMYIAAEILGNVLELIES